MFNTSWNILLLNNVFSSVHQWIYFSLFYPVGTKSDMANPSQDEVIIHNTSTLVDFSAEAEASASTSGINLVSTSNLAGHKVLFHIWNFQICHQLVEVSFDRHYTLLGKDFQGCLNKLLRW